MAQIKNIGKNTIGDNSKMKVALHDYEMSTHDLSFIWRNTQSPGTLVPFMKILAQKGDIFDIQLISKTLTHPTSGPLFGAYKIQHFVFNCPIRLYNSWLHNNRLGIGLKMSDIKFPKLAVPLSAKGQRGYSSSSLLSYLGIKGFRKTTDTTSTRSLPCAIPYLAYWDIFKNYFANTQEENAYKIGSSTKEPTGIILRTTRTSATSQQLPYNSTEQPNYIMQTNNSIELVWDGTASSTQWNEVWSNIKITITISGVKSTYTVAEKTASANGASVTLNINNFTLNTVEIDTQKVNEILSNGNGTRLVSFPLKNIDEMRDLILKTPGNTILSTNNFPQEPYKAHTLSELQSPQEGLAVKTYDSDVFMNWVNTDWIDGANGINELSAVGITDGKFTMDTLNMAQKVYNMLNRIAVSGGTYRDWLDTVYTAGSYMERPETPIFEGGMSQLIEFQEVVSTVANKEEDQPLGSLAGRGRAGNQKGSGKLHFRCSEPSYIIGIVAITPIIDYSQGNDWDIYLNTMDDLHKPALDGIGYQDSLARERAWFGAWYTEGGRINNQSPGKTVAWINYMTNFNKTFGNFAAGESEAYMCLNKYFYESETGDGIRNLSTYIDPSEHNEIFADTNINAMNFWVQTAVECYRRGNYSAKQIPNL